MQVTSNVFQSHVCDPGTPGQIQAAKLAEILSNQFDAVVCDLGAAREAECGQIWEAVNHVDHTVVGDLPARMKSKSVGGVTLQVEGREYDLQFIHSMHLHL